MSNDSKKSLMQYAEQLLIGTGISADDAATVACAQSAGGIDTPVVATLRDGWAAAHGNPRGTGATTGSVEWFDLGQRLAADAGAHAVERLAHAPVPSLIAPVAVRARRVRDRISVTVVTGTGSPQTADGADALDLLYSLDIRITADTWRTLVIDDHHTLPTLLALARSASRDGTHADTAAHIAWWGERQDFPGTSAQVNLLAACPTRWVTGAGPDLEAHPATWRRWLGIDSDDVSTVLQVLDELTVAPPLSGLEEIRIDDSWSWQFAQADHADGRDWRAPDTVSRAATGLRSRCDIADLYAAALLTDPLHRRRAVHTGHVATGTVTVDRSDSRGRTIRITCDRLDARLRAGDSVIGWVGQPDARTQSRWSGTIVGATVADGKLVFDLTVVAAQRPSDSASVTLLSAPPNAKTMANGRKRYRRLYGTRQSWLTTGRRPSVARRDVPLDVIFAPTY